MLQGTTADNALRIAHQGFDERLSERLSERALYGSGVYFTIDACKAAQYSGSDATRCIIVARAILGHPFMAQGPMHSSKRAPLVADRNDPHDCVIAHPGIPNGEGKGKSKGRQAHWEFVSKREDVYPELFIYF